MRRPLIPTLKKHFTSGRFSQSVSCILISAVILYSDPTDISIGWITKILQLSVERNRSALPPIFYGF